jgi:hypothetical protein
MGLGLLDMFGANSQAGGGLGILGSIAERLRNNSGAMIGYGGGGYEGMIKGQRNDMYAEEQQRERLEQAAKVKAAQMQAQALGIDPVLAAGDPQTVAALYRQKMTPKEPRQMGFEERLYNSLDDEQKKQYVQSKMGGGKSDLTQQTQQRADMAKQMGLTPDHPAYQSYVLTGRMPREDAQPLTATDKKAIQEADEMVLSADNSIKSLGRALELSKTAYDGATAPERGWAAGNLGIAGGQETQLLDNEVQSNALASMKAIFGANPTEGERQILLEIQGSSRKPKAVRDEIYRRGAQLAEKRLESYKQRASELRGGSYYKPGGGSGFNGAPSSGFTAPVQVDGYTIRRK